MFESSPPIASTLQTLNAPSLCDPRNSWKMHDSPIHLDSQDFILLEFNTVFLNSPFLCLNGNLRWWHTTWALSGFHANVEIFRSELMPNGLCLFAEKFDHKHQQKHYVSLFCLQISSNLHSALSKFGSFDWCKIWKRPRSEHFWTRISFGFLPFSLKCCIMPKQGIAGFAQTEPSEKYDEKAKDVEHYPKTLK